jgi:hypothetical protein
VWGGTTEQERAAGHGRHLEATQAQGRLA